MRYLVESPSWDWDPEDAGNAKRVKPYRAVCEGCDTQHVIFVVTSQIRGKRGYDIIQALQEEGWRCLDKGHAVQKNGRISPSDRDWRKLLCKACIAKEIQDGAELRDP